MVYIPYVPLHLLYSFGLFIINHIKIFNKLSKVKEHLFVIFTSSSRQIVFLWRVFRVLHQSYRLGVVYHCIILAAQAKVLDYYFAVLGQDSPLLEEFLRVLKGQRVS